MFMTSNAYPRPTIHVHCILFSVWLQQWMYDSRGIALCSGRQRDVKTVWFTKGGRPKTSQCLRILIPGMMRQDWITATNRNRLTRDALGKVQNVIAGEEHNSGGSPANAVTFSPRRTSIIFASGRILLNPEGNDERKVRRWKDG